MHGLVPFQRQVLAGHGRSPDAGKGRVGSHAAGRGRQASGEVSRVSFLATCP